MRRGETGTYMGKGTGLLDRKGGNGFKWEFL